MSVCCFNWGVHNEEIFVWRCCFGVIFRNSELEAFLLLCVSSVNWLFSLLFAPDMIGDGILVDSGGGVDTLL